MVETCPHCGGDLSELTQFGEEDPQLRELCEMLNRKIIANGYRPSNITKAALGAIERLMRLDNHTYEEIVAMIEWCQTDEFWLHNIRSPQKLRKHFDTMQGQMRRQKKPELERQAMIERDAQRAAEAERRQREQARRFAEQAAPMPANLREVLKRGIS